MTEKTRFDVRFDELENVTYQLEAKTIEDAIAVALEDAKLSGSTVFAKKTGRMRYRKFVARDGAITEDKFYEEIIRAIDHLEIG